MKKKPQIINRPCPKCGSPLAIKKSKYGAFIGCTNYPFCKFSESIKEEKSDLVRQADILLKNAGCDNLTKKDGMIMVKE